MASVAVNARGGALPLALRIGVVRGEKIAGERIVRAGEPPGEGVPLPPGVRFEATGAGFVLHVPAGVRGRVAGERGAVEVAPGRTVLPLGARGKLEVPGGAVLFQVVAAPPEPVRRPDFRPTLIDEEDPLFLGLLGALSLTASLFCAWVWSTPLPEARDFVLIEEASSIVDRLALPLPPPPPRPEVTTTTAPAPRPRPAPAPAPSDTTPSTPGEHHRPLIVGTFGEGGQTAIDRVLGPDDIDVIEEHLSQIHAPDEASRDVAFHGGGGHDGDARAEIVVHGVPGGSGHELGTASPEVRVHARVESPPPRPGDEPQPDQVRGAVRAAQGRFETCTTQALKADPSLSGRVSVGWSVVEGRVVGAHVVDNDTGSAALGECFQRAVRTIRFPSTLSAEVAEYPWVVSGG